MGKIALVVLGLPAIGYVCGLIQNTSVNRDELDRRVKLCVKVYDTHEKREPCFDDAVAAFMDAQAAVRPWMWKRWSTGA
jgi:hypothetical protein